MMNIRRGLAICMALIGSCLATTSFAQTAAAPASAENQAILKRARDSYYNLKTEKMAGFHCAITPNWDVMLADVLKQNPEGARKRIDKLKQIRFQVDVGSEGYAKVTHNEVAPDDSSMEEGFKQIYGGMDQMITGFFQTWAPFMVGPPFPEVAGAYDLQNQGSQYVLTYKEGTADVATSMQKNFAITELKVTTPEFNSSIRPQFNKTPMGFVMSGYEATYQGANGANATQLSVGVDYQPIDGLQIPHNLNVKATVDSGHYEIQVAFSGCRVEKNAK